ncbi:MAG: 4Fe-4S dicluster domain-containing protein, partial [Candidatus Hodarchaeales archaeon]
AGGAGFPAHVKLKAKVSTYIANGAECEPLLHVDQQLMSLHPDLVVKGLQLAMSSTGASRGIIALKKKYKSAIAALEEVVKEDKRIELFLLDDFYPAGDEHVLVYEIMNKQIPEAGLPLDIDVVVNNVGTLINIALACDGTPVQSRYVTITGAVKNPVTLELPLGTTFSSAIKAAGGPAIERYKVIHGGPMMGHLVKKVEEEPVTKTTSGIIVLPENHFLVKRKKERISSKVVISKAACIRCQLCTEVCPRFMLGHDLHPDKIMRAVAFGGLEKTDHLTSAFLCIDCGACTFYGCPMGLDPCKITQEVRLKLYQAGLKNPHHRKNLQAHQERELRKLPVKRLVHRLGLSDYDHPAPLSKAKIDVQRVRIPLKQHIGVPCLPVVSVGDKVIKGDPIGKIPDGSLGATVHASISGIVEQVTDIIVIERN